MAKKSKPKKALPKKAVPKTSKPKKRVEVTDTVPPPKPKKR